MTTLLVQTLINNLTNETKGNETRKNIPLRF
jgi:hypothetical protein